MLPISTASLLHDNVIPNPYIKEYPHLATATDKLAATHLYSEYVEATNLIYWGLSLDYYGVPEKEEVLGQCLYEACSKAAPCSPGMQCVAKTPYYSQCLEIEYDSTYTMCYRTVNGQGSGKSWGCTSNDDCCNPSAMCNTATKQCTLPCLNTIDTLHEHEESGESETEDAAASSLGMLGAPVFNLAALGIIFGAFLGGRMLPGLYLMRTKAAAHDTNEKSIDLIVNEEDSRISVDGIATSIA